MKKIEIVQFKAGNFNTIEDIIAEENVLRLEINSEISFDVIITPESIKEWVYGNLFTEGFIKAKDDVESYTETKKEDLISVAVEIKSFASKKRFLKKNYNIVWTECGSSTELKRLADQFKPIKNKLKIKGNKIVNIFDEIKDKIELFKQTGAFHYAFLFDKELKVQAYAYDIGRHNAVDKVIGSQILKTERLDDKVLFTTGRISSDILLKCLRVKIPMLISRSAPLATAISLAKKYNVCLIGFLRGKRFNIYSYPDSII